MSVSLTQVSSGRGPSLVLLHPLGADSRFWGPLLSGFEGREVWTMDLGGHGDSAVPEAAYSLAELSETVARTIDDEVLGDGDGTVALFGVSYGGIVAQHVAALRPEVVTHVVLADTVMTYPEPMREMWTERAATVRAHGTAAIAAATIDMWFSPDAVARRPELRADCLTMLAATQAEAYARACEALRGADTTAALPGVRASTLVICGEDDKPPFVSAATELAGVLPGPGEVAWLDGARHAAVIEQPGRTASLVSEHLDGPA